MKVIIVEDHALMREFLAAVCAKSPDVAVLAVADSGEKAIAVIADLKPDVVLLDIELPDIDGFEVLGKVREAKVYPRVVVITAYGSPYTVIRVENAHVEGFLNKCDQTSKAITNAIGALRCNRTYFSDSYQRMKANLRKDPFSIDKILTDQQMSVVLWVARLQDDVSIGKKLNITARTVEAHRTNIMHKLGIHSRTQLIDYARGQGFF